ncbi:MAG: hypothetical protein B0W54_11535 [Cellvibrio sp. 79]|nr:MAG: hypothetical protein B0W54_11535 [Cellvibrio sp. 79]
MAFKKMFSFLWVVAGLTVASCTIAQDDGASPALRIEPAYADLLDSQTLDIAVYLPLSIHLSLYRSDFEPIYPSPYPSPALAPQRGPAALKIQALVNDKDVSAWFHECIHQYMQVDAPERVLLCKNLDYSPFKEGVNELKISIQQFNEPPHIGIAHYRVSKSQRKFHDILGWPEPRRFVVRGTSFNTASHINVAVNQRVIIKAAGLVNVWPSNIGHPLSTPKGIASCGQLCLLPTANHGALLVKIGAYGRWLVAGDNYLLIADRPGELFFAVNDKTSLADNSDNLGSYEVSVARY